MTSTIKTKINVGYLRLSKEDAKRAASKGNPTRDLSEAINRQRRNCTKLAGGEGGDVDRWFTDDDTSASREGVARLGWDALLVEIRSGRVACIFAFKQDRLVRRPEELETLIKLCRKHRVRIVTGDGEVNVMTTPGRTMARVSGVVSIGEAETNSDRVREALADNAVGGKHHGAEAFGWDRHYEFDSKTGRKLSSKDVINPREQALLIDAATRLLAGESLRSIAAEWDAAGVVSRRGKPLDRFAIRNLLLRTRNVGWREHHGEIVSRDTTWPALLDEKLFTRVRALLTDPSRMTARTDRRHLLSGIATCQCGSVLRGAVTVARTGATPRLVYKCEVNFCVTRSLDLLDDYVLDLVETWMGTAEAAKVLSMVDDADTSGALAELESLRAKATELTDMLTDGDLDRPAYNRAMARLRPRIDAAEKAVSAVSGRPSYADVLAADDPAAAFIDLSFDRKRALLRELFAIVVKPTALRGRAASKIEESSVSFTTREDLPRATPPAKRRRPARSVGR